MAKFKNYWKVAGMVCLILCLCVAFAACGNGNETTTTQEPTKGNSTYTIQVSTIGGRLLENISVYVYTDSGMGDLETMKQLDENGSMSFTAVTSDTYVAVLMGVPAGYNVQEYYAINGDTTEIVLTSSVITDAEVPANTVYELGDVVYDFTITAADGTQYNLAQLLQEKDAVVLNFWYLNCSPCKIEFPYLEMAYAEYSDRIEVLAINCEDGSDPELNAFAQEYELTMPLAIGDKSYWYPMAYGACPTTIVIDRYGTIVYMHAGYFDEVAPFNAMFRMVTGEEYEQVLMEEIESYITEDDYRPDGSQERPFEMGGSIAFDVKVPANSEVYYNLYRLNNVIMHIEDPNAYVIIDGQRYDPVDGVIELMVSCPDTFTPLNVAFGNSGSTKSTIHVQFIFEPGDVNNPIELVLGDNEVTVDDVNGLGTYYTYTATTSGVLTLTVQGCTDQATPDIHLYNENTFESVYLSSEGVTDPETGLISISITIQEGDRIQIIFSASTEPEITLSSVAIQALASVKEDEGSGVIDGKTGYAVYVVDQDGNPVEGVSIYLSAGTNSRTLTTKADGSAAIRLVKDAYFLELEVPNGYVADTTSYMWSPALSTLTIRLTATTPYSVQLQTDTGVFMEGVLVRVYADEALEKMLYAISTDAEGKIEFVGTVATTYYLAFHNTDETLIVEAYYVTEGEETVITVETVKKEIIYNLGDAVQDFTVTDVDGISHTLSELLQEKKAVVLTFWKSASVPSTLNMSYLQQAYEKYGDQIAVLGMSPMDITQTELRLYQTLYGLDFPLVQCDEKWIAEMQISDYPTTVIIDREGKICLIHTGPIADADTYDKMVGVLTAEDYTHVSFENLDALLNYAKESENSETPET